MTAGPVSATHLMMVPWLRRGKSPIVPKTGTGSFAPTISTEIQLGTGRPMGGTMIRPRKTPAGMVMRPPPAATTSARQREKAAVLSVASSPTAP